MIVQLKTLLADVLLAEKNPIDAVLEYTLDPSDVTFIPELATNLFALDLTKQYDLKDFTGRWYKGRVSNFSTNMVLVKFGGWTTDWYEMCTWHTLASRIAPCDTFSVHDLYDDEDYAEVVKNFLNVQVRIYTSVKQGSHSVYKWTTGIVTAGQGSYLHVVDSQGFTRYAHVQSHDILTMDFSPLFPPKYSCFLNSTRRLDFQGREFYSASLLPFQKSIKVDLWKVGVEWEQGTIIECGNHVTLKEFLTGILTISLPHCLIDIIYSYDSTVLVQSTSQTIRRDIDAETLAPSNSQTFVYTQGRLIP